MPTRVTCVSTGTSRSPYANSSTHAAVLRPTPGRRTRYSRASCSGARGSQSSESSCGGSRGSAVMACRIALMRAALTLEMPPGLIARSIRATGASRTAVQVPKRARRRR